MHKVRIKTLKIHDNLNYVSKITSFGSHKSVDTDVVQDFEEFDRCTLDWADATQNQCALKFCILIFLSLPKIDLAVANTQSS
jgi:hypothetical protein